MTCKVARAVLLLAFVAAASALTYNPNDWKPEKSFCPPVTPDPKLDINWMRSVNYWFLRKSTKRNYYVAVKTAMSTSEFKGCTDKEIQESCFVLTGFKPDCVFVELYGLNRKMHEWTYSFRPNRDGIIDFFLSDEYVFTTYIVLTDNKTYRLQIDEHKDGTRDFRLSSVGDNIPAGEMEKVYKKLESYGWSKADIYSTKQSCSSDSYVQSIMNGSAKK